MTPLTQSAVTSRKEKERAKLNLIRNRYIFSCHSEIDFEPEPRTEKLRVVRKMHVIFPKEDTSDCVHGPDQNESLDWQISGSFALAHHCLQIWLLVQALHHRDLDWHIVMEIWS